MKQGFLDYYEANLSLLKKHHTHVWEMMTGQDVMPVGEVFFSAGDKINLKVTDTPDKVVYLHDSTDPEAEVPLFLNMVHESSMGVVALIGMGLGYTPLALLRERSNIRFLAVFEADPGIFAQALKSMDLSTMLSDPRLILSIGPEPAVGTVFAPAARSLRLEPIHMLEHVPSFTFDNVAYQKLYDLAFGYANQLNIGAATTFRFGHEFINNRFTHLTSIHHNCLLESLKGKFSEMPAIMVAGGPSLDKNIHLLKEAEGKAIVLAVDTVLPALLNHGIIPDFVTSIDPQELTYEKFADVVPRVKGMPFLICSAWVNPKVPKVFSADQVFWSFSGNPIEKWLNTLMGGSINTGGAGTVAHMNMIAAVVMGCSPIVFVGQDLAFTDDKDHAGDVVLTNRKGMENILNSGDMIKVDGINGTKVSTCRGFLTLKMTFEQMIKNDPGHYINATEGGVHIEGTEVLPLREVLDTYCTNNHDISSLVQNCSKNADFIDPKVMLAEFSSVNKTVKKLRKIIKKADALSRRLQHELKKHHKSRARYRAFDALPNSMQKQIAEVDSCHKKIDKENKIWKLLEDITMEGLRQSERMLQKVGRCKDDPARYLEWLSLNMERLDLLNRVRTEVLDVFEKNIAQTLDYYETEKKLISMVKIPDANGVKALELARFYFETGNYMLARPMLEHLIEVQPDAADVNFFLGSIFALQTDYAKAELCFEKALTAPNGYEAEINRFRQTMGDLYFGYAQVCAAADRNASIAMYLKGIRYCVEHEGIRQRLTLMLSEDLEKIQKNIESGKLNEAAPVIGFWYGHFEKQVNLAAIFSANMMSEFYKCRGHLLILKNDLPGGAESTGQALEFAPDDPDLHVAMTEVLFAQNEFDKGIGHLNRAVALNRNYAKYWENIGDNLQETGQAADAVSAYEQCFTALPEHIVVLKKIGDCYQLMEQYEAAAEAYRQFKRLSEKKIDD